ncbi:hypothetical protein O3M35_010030 [Rhynocoris fuscipes]|uniref:NADH dehydrogenase subunit 4L n=1 Tax=Rhynocoris fuscipes TaxID=488301 RepID=A0AAW1D4K7_9HEMI
MFKLEGCTCNDNTLKALLFFLSIFIIFCLVCGRTFFCKFSFNLFLFCLSLNLYLIFFFFFFFFFFLKELILFLNIF